MVAGCHVLSRKEGRATATWSKKRKNELAGRPYGWDFNTGSDLVRKGREGPHLMILGGGVRSVRCNDEEVMTGAGRTGDRGREDRRPGEGGASTGARRRLGRGRSATRERRRLGWGGAATATAGLCRGRTESCVVRIGNQAAGVGGEIERGGDGRGNHAWPGEVIFFSPRESVWIGLHSPTDFFPHRTSKRPVGFVGGAKPWAGIALGKRPDSVGNSRFPNKPLLKLL